MSYTKAQLKSLSQVVVDSVRTRRVLAEPATIDARRSLCFECPHQVAAKCARCGCSVQRKTAAFAAKCPDGKW